MPWKELPENIKLVAVFFVVLVLNYFVSEYVFLLTTTPSANAYKRENNLFVKLTGCQLQNMIKRCNTCIKHN